MNDKPSNVRFHVTSAQFEYWENKVWPQDQRRGIRLGQSYSNHFSEFQHPEYKDLPDYDLFYEEDKKRAKEMVWSCTILTDE